jgi:hypothetical protein
MMTMATIASIGIAVLSILLSIFTANNSNIKRTWAERIGIKRIISELSYPPRWSNLTILSLFLFWMTLLCETLSLKITCVTFLNEIAYIAATAGIVSLLFPLLFLVVIWDVITFS